MRSENETHYGVRLASFRRESQSLPASAPERVVFLGDALIEALDLRRLFPGRSVHNRGIDGDRLDHQSGRSALHRVDAPLLVPNPTVVVVHLGLFDLVDGVTVPVAVARYAALLDALAMRWPRARIVCVSLTPVRDAYAHLAPQVRAMNDALVALAARVHASWVDAHAPLADAKGLLHRRFARDGLRLLPEAHHVFSAPLARALGFEGQGPPSRAMPSTRGEALPPISSAAATAEPDTRPDPTLPLQHGDHPALHTLVAAQARETPDAIAVTDGESESVTFGELARASARLSHHLSDKGVARSDVVVVWADRAVALPWALLGVLGAGAAFAILDPTYPSARLAAAIRLVRPRGIVALESAGPIPALIAAVLDEVGCDARVSLPNVPGRGEPCANDPEHAPDLAVRGDEIAYLSFTSGTTGQPKGIVGTHAPLTHFLSWHVRTFGFGPHERFSMLAGLAHDPLLRDVFTPLVCGATLVVPPRSAMRDPTALRAFLAEERVSVVHLTPSLGQLLCHAHERSESYRTLPELRFAFFAGEVLKHANVARFSALAPNATCVNFFGATETPQAMGHYVIAPDECRSGMGGAVPVGRGIADVQLIVLTGRGDVAGVGEVGEICVRTPYLTVGYLGDDALTSARYVQNPFRFEIEASDRLYRTGDLGNYRDDGVVEVRGRADRQVKVRGFRVELDEIESALVANPNVHNAVASTVTNADGEVRIVAHVAATGVTANALRAFLRERLPEYMVPSHVRVTSSLPLTANGKVDRSALPALDDLSTLEAPPSIESATGDDAHDDVERRLSTIWREVLRAPTVARDDSFFDLGGDSLRGLQLLTRIEEVFGRRLPVNVLLLASSIAQMAELLRVGARPPESSLLVPIREGSRPPVYWLPGGGGLSVVAFRAISHRLGADQAVYGLEADLDLERAPTTLEGIVRTYMDEIRRKQPHGPYHLLGFSLGSFIAYELAVQLRAAGEPVGLLVVFDTEVPSTVTRGERLRIVAERAKFRVSSIVRERSPYALAAYAKNLADAVRERAAAIAAPPRKPTVFDVIVERNVAAVRTYAARPLPRYDGKVTCILARRTSMHGVDPAIDPRLGWRHFADGGVEVHHVDGNHLSMLEPPDVEDLGTTLRACIRRAQGIDPVESRRGPRSSATPAGSGPLSRTRDSGA